MSGTRSNDPEYRRLAFLRALELLNLTIAEPRHWHLRICSCRRQVRVARERAALPAGLVGPDVGMEEDSGRLHKDEQKSGQKEMGS
jgi:hypothetical protein